VTFLNHDRGMPLGLGSGSFSEVSIGLPQNSRLVLYSDGITEAADLKGEEYGTARLEKLAMAPSISPESILADVRKHANGTGLQDDATVIVVSA